MSICPSYFPLKLIVFASPTRSLSCPALTDRLRLNNTRHLENFSGRKVGKTMTSQKRSAESVQPRWPKVTSSTLFCNNKGLGGSDGTTCRLLTSNFVQKILFALGRKPPGASPRSLGTLKLFCRECACKVKSMYQLQRIKTL